MRRALNAAQQHAVSTTEGPVLVVAGPGTGKTEILAARIANILATTDAKPENILCLTYTDAGTIAMRTRLLEFIGPDAYRVDVLTFHSFCSRVITEQSEHFGHADLSAASDLERYHVARAIIDSFHDDHPLLRETGDIYFEASRLLELYGIMKSEAWTPEYLINRTDAHLAKLPTDPEYCYKRNGKTKAGDEYKKGDLNEGKLAEARNKAEQFQAAAATFPAYQALMSEKKRYDFADMIAWVDQAFKASPALLGHYQDQYLYVLVDEFQDTSGSQYELLMQLVNYSDCPNVFAVGDDDQSIYRFQGASVENLRAYQERFGSFLTSISLTENHRSSQLILDAAGGLIARNKERLEVNKKLKAVNSTVCALEDQPTVQVYPTLALESAGIGSQILKLKESGVELDKIAVIYRNHRQSEDLIRFLSAHDISVTTRKRADILQEPLTVKLLDILRYLAAELRRPHSGESYLFKLLHDSWFGLSPLTLAKLSTHISRKHAKLAREEEKSGMELAVKAKVGGGDLFGVVQSGLEAHWRSELISSDCKEFSGDERLTLAKAGRAIDEMISAAAEMPLRDLFHLVLSKVGVLPRALGGVDQVWNLQLINTLFDFLRDEGIKGGLDLGSFLSLIDDMLRQNIALPVEKLSDTGCGVNFVTAHGSKGLEFDHVFVIGCVSKAWDSAPRNRTYSLPPTVWRSIAGSEEEEARRLFYVAMTRAKKALIISFSKKDNGDKELEKSRFVAELAESGCPVIEVAADDRELIAFGEGVLAVAPKRAFSLYDDGFVESLLKDYALSVSHLSAYLKCPTAFYFTRLLHAPGPASIARSFGLAVHAALEFAFKFMVKAAPKAFPAVEDFMREFHRNMLRHQADFNPTEFNRRMVYAESILPHFYSQHVLSWNTNSLAEVSIRAVVGGVPITGKLDRVEFLDDKGNIDVADDKTGSYVYAKKKMKGPDQEKTTKAVTEGKKPSHEIANGGDYWRQAVFYRILAEADAKRDWTVNGTRFEFVEPDKDSGEYPIDVVEASAGDVELVKRQIHDTYKNIQAKEFSNGCGDPDCEWCQFVTDLAA